MKTPVKMWIYAVPNGITTANVICGFGSLLASIRGEFAFSAWLIISAGIFDLFDGRIARLLNASSSFGQEYDTLSDLLSFGVAPAILFYQFGFSNSGLWGEGFALFYLLCVMLRLARFTVALGAPSTGFFTGLSSPVSAAIASSFILFSTTQVWEPRQSTLFSSVLFLFLGALMVSHMRFPSFKNVNWKGRGGLTCLGTLAVLLVLALMAPRFYLFPILASLLGVALIYDLSLRLRSAQGEDSAEENATVS